MRAFLRKLWDEFKEGIPGKRFVAHNRRHRDVPRSQTARIGWVVLGALLILVGIVELFIPGPGVLFLVAGAALIARESKPAAHLLDRIELKLSAFGTKLLGKWRKLRGKP